MKKRIIVIGIVLTIVVVLVSLIGTFASDSTVANNDNSYNITLTGNNGEISVPAGSSKTAIYQITNTNKGVVQYGVAYSGEAITVKVYNDTIDSVTGFMDYGETKFIKLYIENSGTTDSIASIQAVLGYEYGGELDVVVPSGYTLVTEEYSPPKLVNIITYITNLYTNATKTTASNNGITYNYASALGLMNDRLGDSNVGADSGNIRYYGANPNNYIYFNCQKYPDTNCELWRIIGLFKDVEMADGTTQDLVKIARVSTLDTTMAWDSAGISEWTTASLNTYLNGEYYTGLKSDTTRNMIAEIVWNLGAEGNISIKPNVIYASERGTFKCGGCTYTTWPGKVALMYPSDYGYATEFTKCSSDLFEYDSTGCYDNDWLYQTGAVQWLLTPYSGQNGYVWYVHSSGSVYNGGIVQNVNGVRPVLHLDPDLGIVEDEGDGTSSNPYRIAIN